MVSHRTNKLIYIIHPHEGLLPIVVIIGEQSSARSAIVLVQKIAAVFIPPKGLRAMIAGVSGVDFVGLSRR